MSASVSFYVDSKTSFHLCRYGARRAPILTLGGEGYDLAIASHPTVPLAEQLSFARDLVENAAGFLAALELFAAAHTDAEQAR